MHIDDTDDLDDSDDLNDSDDLDEESEDQECPYCSSTDGCEHVLLVVDRTFRQAEGGLLMDAFNERWSMLCEEGGDDFEEREPFEELLEEIEGLADAFSDWDHEGGPGMSSAYSIYYAESAEKARDALKRLEIRADR